MSRSSTFRTAQNLLVPGLCFAAVLLWLSAVANATPWNGEAVQTSAPLSLPENPDLSVREKREALLRRALGRVATSAQSLESLTDLDGSLALPAMMPTFAPADSQGPNLTAANRQTWWLSPTGGVQSRAPPPST
ncbi:MAG: hypothetical protein RIM72_00490 [Alphaproteobacteria bacterium]